jgi:hypothetical protein
VLVAMKLLLLLTMMTMMTLLLEPRVGALPSLQQLVPPCY